MTKYEELLLEVSRREDMMDSARGVLSTIEGEKLFKHLFKMFDLGKLPEQGLKGEDLHERIGFLRAGDLFLKVMLEANPLVTARLITQLDNERVETIKKEIQSELERERNA